jgi:catechol 2,3-dioxygenase-like lactoylglutathione lyase family enzyme
MLEAIPALPVRDMSRSVEFYREKLGFELVHREGGFAIFRPCP